MDAEPRGHTIDGIPWEEPRPPHLPDRLTSISPWVLPFLAVVVFQFWVFWLDQPFGTDPRSPLEYLLGIRYQFAAIAGSMIGFALFLRHADARTTLPQIATGAFLLLLAHVMGLLESTLAPVFATLAPPSDEVALYSPLSQAYSISTALVGVFGIAFIASGLSAARRFEDTRPMRRLAVVLAILAVVSSAFSVLGLTTLEFDVTPVLVLSVVGTLFARFFETLTLAYLLVVSLTGWLAQEAPRSGWRLAAIGAGLLLLQALVPFVGVVPLPQEGLLTLFGYIADGVLVGWVLLMVAFAVGLPSTESVVEEEMAGATLDRPAATPPGSEGG